MITVFIEPHERWDAIDAYRDRLTQSQIDEINDAPDDARIKLEIGRFQTVIEILSTEDDP